MTFTTPHVTDEFTVYQEDTIKTTVSLAILLIDDFTKKEAIGPLKVIIKERDIKPIKNLSGYYVFTDLKDINYTVKITSEFYFPQEKKINALEIRTSDLQLKFGTKGPASSGTSTKLKDVSKLQTDDIIEFHNVAGDVEQKEIIAINASTKQISWAGGLKYSFNGSDDYVVALKNPVIKFCLKPLPSYPFSNHATLIRGLLEYPSKKSRIKELAKDGVKNPVVGAMVKVPNLNIETESDENGEFVLYFDNYYNEIKNDKLSIYIEKTENGKPRFNTNLKDITLKEGCTKFFNKIVS